MTINCDIVVVGAGPVGTVFSYIAAKKGLNVLTLDRKNEIASPLRGGEAVSKFLFESMYEELPLLEKLYKWMIEDTIIYNPISKIISREDKWISYMLNRKEAEKTIAQEAINAGTEIMLGATVTGLTFENNKIKEIKTKTISGDIKIKPKIFAQYPASIPIDIPTTPAPKTTKNETISEIRVPKTTLLKTSRPNSSVPNR